MTDHATLWQMIRNAMSDRADWTVASLSEIITSSGVLDAEDTEQCAPSDKRPKWTRNLRNVLHYRYKSTKQLIYLDRDLYRLNPALASPSGTVSISDQAKRSGADTRKSLEIAEQHLIEQRAFDPANLKDARERIIASIVRRRGRSAFRQQLLAAYQGRCAITACEIEAILEAAHIVPYKGPETDHPGNGLLLRADIHTLFDLGLVAVDENTMTVLISPHLANTEYECYQGQTIAIPNDPESQPSQLALREHRLQAGLGG